MVDVLLIYQNIGEIKVDPIFVEIERLFLELTRQRGLVGLAAGSFVPPNVLLTLASYLESEGISSKVLDLSLESFKGSDYYKKLKLVLKKLNPAIVGISIMEICLLSHNMRIASIIREFNPNIKIIAGGVTATSFAEELLKTGLFDVVVRGEGEITFQEVCKKILRAGSLSVVKGITYLKDGDVKRNEDRELLNLDNLKLPLREIYPLDEMYALNNNIDLVYASRGCPYNCSFCNASSFWSRTWRGRKPDDVVKELAIIEDRGAKIAHVHDVNFVTNNRWVKEVCSKIRLEGLDIFWDCQIRVDSMSKSTLETLHSGNCRGVFIGIEAASQKALDDVNKRYQAAVLLKSLTNAKDVGIHVDGGYVTGLPEDTKETMLETRRLALDLLRSDLVETPIFFIFVPWRDTAIGNSPEKCGIKIVNNNYDDWHGFAPAPLASTKYVDAKTVFDVWRSGWDELVRILNEKIN